MLRLAIPEPQAFACFKPLSSRTHGMSLASRTDTITSAALIHNETIKARLCVPILVTICRGLIQLPIAEQRIFVLGRTLGLFDDHDELPVDWLNDDVKGYLAEVVQAADGVLVNEAHLGMRACWPNEKDRQACLKAVHQVEFTCLLLTIDNAKKSGAARRRAASSDASCPRCV